MTKKYLEFEEFSNFKDLSRKDFIVKNKNNIKVGSIMIDSAYRKYIYVTPHYHIILGSDELRQIANFLDKLNKKHKEKK